MMAPSALLALPGELQNTVFGQLDYISALRLSSTCSYLHFEEIPTTLFSHASKLDAVYAPETWPSNAGSDGAHACSRCFFTLPRQRFALSEITWSRTKAGQRVRSVSVLTAASRPESIGQDHRPPWPTARRISSAIHVHAGPQTLDVIAGDRNRGRDIGRGQGRFVVSKMARKS